MRFLCAGCPAAGATSHAARRRGGSASAAHNYTAVPAAAANSWARRLVAPATGYSFCFFFKKKHLDCLWAVLCHCVSFTGTCCDPEEPVNQRQMHCIVRDVISPAAGSSDRDRISGSARSESRPDRGRLPFVAVGPPLAQRHIKEGSAGAREPTFTVPAAPPQTLT
jgi:hypothetical protein